MKRQNTALYMHLDLIYVFGYVHLFKNFFLLKEWELEYYGFRSVVFTGGDCSPSRDILQHLEMFLIAMLWGGGCDWHWLGRGQGCCQVPCQSQNIFPTAKLIIIQTTCQQSGKISSSKFSSWSCLFLTWANFLPPSLSLFFSFSL